MKKIMFTCLTLRNIFCLFFLSTMCLTANAQTTKYNYDALGRVTFVEDATNGNRDYDYDPAGNRLLVSANTANDESATPPVPPTPPVPTNAKSIPGINNTYTSQWTASAGATYYILVVNGVDHTLTATSEINAYRGTRVRACNSIDVCSADATVVAL